MPTRLRRLFTRRATDRYIPIAISSTLRPFARLEITSDSAEYNALTADRRRILCGKGYISYLVRIISEDICHLLEKASCSCRALVIHDKVHYLTGQRIDLDSLGVLASDIQDRPDIISQKMSSESVTGDLGYHFHGNVKMHRYTTVPGTQRKIDILFLIGSLRKELIHNAPCCLIHQISCGDYGGIYLSVCYEHTLCRARSDVYTHNFRICDPRCLFTVHYLIDIHIATLPFRPVPDRLYRSCSTLWHRSLHPAHLPE